MKRSEAIRRLPSVYAEIIELLDAGADETTIAERLDVEPATVPALVLVARAKLDRLLSPGPGGPAGGAPFGAPGAGGPAVDGGLSDDAS